MARPPRTRFAAPFVVVVAAAGGCSDGKKGDTAPPEPKAQRSWSVHRTGDTCLAHVPMSCPEGYRCNPPPPMQMPCPPQETGSPFKVVSNDGTSCFLEDGTTAVTCPSHEYEPPPPAPIDAAVEVAASLRRWTVSRGGKDCWAAIDPDPCTQLQLKPGDPIPPCNPPAPMKIECPPAHVIAIVETAAETCETDSDAGCDPGVKCNPPRPMPVACPRY